MLIIAEKFTNDKTNDTDKTNNSTEMNSSEDVESVDVNNKVTYEQSNVELSFKWQICACNIDLQYIYVISISLHVYMHEISHLGLDLAHISDGFAILCII